MQKMVGRRRKVAQMKASKQTYILRQVFDDPSKIEGAAVIRNSFHVAGNGVKISDSYLDRKCSVGDTYLALLHQVSSQSEQNRWSDVRSRTVSSM
jgi:hypothetical protein